MRFTLSVLLIALLAYIAGLYLPWWSIAIVSFLVMLLLPQKKRFSFGAGFTAVFLLWLVLALWIDTKNESVLSKKMALVFPLGGSAILMVLVTAFVGALVAGFAALTGSAVRSVISKR